MIGADLDDPSSLTAVFRGVYAMFSNTDGWVMLGDSGFQQRAKAAGKSLLEYTYDTELQHGRNVFDAASKVDGLESLIFSSLSDASK